jgi:hypothetical protein
MEKIILWVSKTTVFQQNINERKKTLKLHKITDVTEKEREREKRERYKV